ncbi:MAG: M2 family metallopeptidase [bacterium]|nr:M2 family metallopeptidase [bacterium]
MKLLSTMIGVMTMALVPSDSGRNAKENQLETFLSAHVKRIKPLSKETRLAHWNASITGKPEDYDRLSKLELEMCQIYSNREEFVFLEGLRESGQVKDAELRRQVERLYNRYLENQIEPQLLKRMIALDTKIARTFNTFRGTIAGETVTLNQINKILTTEADSRKREEAWRASKQVGAAVAGDLLTLVRLRNQAARSIGFDNYHTLSLTTAEQSLEELDKIFAELCELTREPFAELKAELDRSLSRMYGVSPDELMPWHYHDPFFQRTPLVQEVDLDAFYGRADVRKLAEKFYASVGLPVDDILGRSDLYERPGKDQHAYSIDVDREGDVRILCNLTNEERWMETVLHELGHAVYSKYHDPSQPYLLRAPAHAFTTEALAMFFGRLSRNAAWMEKMLGLSEEDRAKIEKVEREYTRFQQIIFARWAMVMYDFEKRLYADPDQDLDSLWWELVEKYQLLKKPPEAPRAAWASKTHFTTAPCYYHNYMLGELLASQLHNCIVHSVLQRPSDEGLSYVGETKAGDFLREKVFGPGAVYHWNEMIQRATGERLTPKYFVAQFVR